MKNKNEYDPIEHIEETLKDIHDGTGMKTRSVLKKYPIAFSLLVTFSLVSVLHGFELVFDKIPFIHNNPWILIVTGLATLIITGSIYKTLESHR